VEGGYDEAHHAAERHAGSAGIPYVHAFSDPAVVGGQGTVGLEILRDLPEVATLLVPVGGGGLVGGIGVALRQRSPGTRLIGVQSEATSAMHDSWKAGALRSPPVVATLCEGLSGDVDEVSLSLARRVMDDIVLVEESMVAEAIRRLFLDEGVVAEGSAAVCAAAVWNGLVAPSTGPTAIVITGGNLDPARLASLLAEGPRPSASTSDRIS
jgi:threonine dehydratase